MLLSTTFCIPLMFILLFNLSCRYYAVPAKKYQQLHQQVQQQEDRGKPALSADSFLLLHYPDYYRFQSPRTSSPMDFLRALADTTAQLTLADTSTVPIPYVHIVDDFPADWITETQMDSIMPFIHSRKKCKCSVNRLSSFFPDDSAHLGGFVIKLAEAFENHEPLHLGLWSCPKYDAGKANQLAEWWDEQQSIQ